MTTHNNEYEEKLKRIINPQTIEDYGLSLTGDEFYQTEIGKVFIDAFNDHQKEREFFLSECNNFASNFSKKQEEIIFNTLYGNKNDNA